MSIRVEVTEEQWVGGLREADYVVLDLTVDVPRPWLEEAVDEVELIGRVHGRADQAMLERALELDVDFLSLGEAAEGFDARRLPLRLMVERHMAEVGESPDLFGAAWARRIGGWGQGDREALAGLARRERIFLSAPDELPPAEWLQSVAPFAIAAPEGCDPADVVRIRSL